MKKTARRAMISTICMLVVGVMSLTGVTYAWFSQGTQAQVEEFTVNVQTASGSLMIGQASGTSISWGNTITPFSSSNPAGTLAPVSTVGTTTAGAIAFYSASINEANAAQIKNVVSVGETTTVGDQTYKNYVKFNFFIDNSTNSEALPVYLDATSGVTGSNKSELAARFAFVPQSTFTPTEGVAVTTNNFSLTGTSATIFEPNHDTHTTNGAVYQAGTTLGNTAGGAYVYHGIKAEGESADTTYGRYTDATVLAAVNTKLIGDENAIVTVPANSYQMVTVYIWLEGQDADCLNDVAGAAFNVNLKLTLTQPGTEENA